MLRSGMPFLDSPNGYDELSRSHTLEISDLRKFLGLRESALPCLAFTLLGADASCVQPMVAVPLSVIQDAGVYGYVKRLAEELEDYFHAIDVVGQRVKELEHVHRNSETILSQLPSLRQSVRSDAAGLATPEVREAAAAILQLTGSEGRSTEMRSVCFRHFQVVRQEHRSQTGIIPKLQRLISLSFSSKALPHSFDENDQCQLSRDIIQLRSEQAQAWSDLGAALQKGVQRKDPVTKSDQWDFFIAYAAADRSVAERVFDALTEIGRPFLDVKCLRPGDHWTERLQVAQDSSKCTLLVVTKETPRSWFAESEYLRAIGLVRSGAEHVVVPVLYGHRCKLPYGLEQVQAIRLQEWTDIDRLPGLLQHIVGSRPPES